MFDGLVLTKLGKAELIKATDEGCLNFTHIAFGDGVTNDLYNLKDGLSHEVARLKITEVERTDDRIILSLDYTNRSFDKGFYFRELGIIANNKLCYYDNSGSDAEYIDPMNEVVTKEKRLRIELIVSESVAVETTVDSKLYALKKDLAALWDKTLTTIKNQLGDHIVKKDVPENALFTDTWIALKGATSSEDGSAGYAPAPPKGDANRYLRSDGEWEVPPDTRYTHPGYTERSSGLYKITVDSTGHISDVTAVTNADITALGIPGQDTNTTYGAATESTNGLMSAADKEKLNGVAAGANAYSHPGYTARSSGLYKITVDSTGHISDVTAVTKKDITALGIPGQDTNTTYGAATESANGLMSAADKKKLNGVDAGANAYSHPGYTARSSGLYKITVDGTGHVSSVTAVTKDDITALGIVGTSGNTDINGTLTFNSDDQGIRTSKNDYGRIGDSLHAFFETWTNNLFCKHLSNQTKIGTSSDPYDIAYLKQIIDCTTFGGSTAAEQIQFKSYSNHSIEACPAVDNRSNWGLSSKKWYSVWSYAFSGASDRKLKKDIRDIDSEWANEFIDRLKPSSYRFKDNSYGKVHTGFIAQDVEEAMLELGMDRRDFAGLVKTIKPKDTDVDYKTYSESIDDPDNFEGPDENYDYCLRYDDFIAPIVAYCQGLKKKSLELEVRCDQLEKKVELLENKIS